jgi:hypothetical protein
MRDRFEKRLEETRSRVKSSSGTEAKPIQVRWMKTAISGQEKQRKKSLPQTGDKNVPGIHDWLATMGTFATEIFELGRTLKEAVSK